MPRGLSRRRPGNNEGGILGLIDGNRPGAARHNNRRTKTTTKAFITRSSSRSSSSSSSSEQHDNDDSSCHTPPKTVLFSKLAGSPMQDDSVAQEEQVMSDISGTPDSSTKSELEQSFSESTYSLKPRPLFTATDVDDAYGADLEYDENESSEDGYDSGGDESSGEEEESTNSSADSVPTPDTPGATSSLGEGLIDQDNVSFDSARESVESIDLDEDEIESEVEQEESDDEEYVVEESSGETDDEDLDEDIVLEHTRKQRRGRPRKQAPKAAEKEAVKDKVQPEVAAARNHDNVQETVVVTTDETALPEESSSETEDEDLDEVFEAKLMKKQRRGRPRKRKPAKEAVKENTKPETGVQKDKTTKPTEKKITKPKQQRRGRPRKQAAAVKEKVLAEEVKPAEQSLSKSPAKKKETIYESNRDREFSGEEEMVVVAEVLEGVHLDDEDVVTAEVLNESNEQTDVDVTTIVMDEAEEDSNEVVNDEFCIEESKETESLSDGEVDPGLDAEGAPSVDGHGPDVVPSPTESTSNTVESSSELVMEHEIEAMEEDIPVDEANLSSEAMLAEVENGGEEARALSPTEAMPSGNTPGTSETNNVQAEQDSVDGTDDVSESSLHPADEDAPFELQTRNSPEQTVPSESDAADAVMPTTEAPTSTVDDSGNLASPIEDTTCNDDVISASHAETVNSSLLVSKREDALETSLVPTPAQASSDGEAEEVKEPKRRPRLRRFRSEGSIKPGKWGTGSKIGVGSFGVVRVGMNKKTGTLMAVKSITVSTAVMKDIQTEIDLLKSLDHINIVRYLGAETDGTHLHIFQEWVPGGSVSSLLHKFGPFSMQVVRAYLFQILSGLAYLHLNRILHRDIKGGNVLVSDAGIVKLADFGSSKRLAQQQQHDAMEINTMRGTPYFMAPEMFEEKYGSKADVWSVGCVAFQMATGSPPWKGMGFTNPMSLFLHIKDTEGIPSYDWPNTEPQEVNFKALLEKCFYRDPSKRPTAKELLSEPFFTASEQSSSEDNQDRALFSPGGDSVSTWGSGTRSPKPTPTRRSPNVVAIGKASFLSPPLPTRIINPGTTTTPRQDVISPLAPSPIVDSSEWPSWARERLYDKKSPYKMRPEGVLLPPTSPSPLGMSDSLAISEDSSTTDVENPYRRRRGERKSGDSSLGKSLVGLDFLEGSKTPGS